MKLFLKKVKYQNDLGICVFGKGRTDIQSKYIIIVLYVNIFNMKLILREVVYVFYQQVISPYSGTGIGRW